MDIILAVAALCIAAPVMLLVSALLSGQGLGHVIFIQERLGRHGKRFNLYKFRKFPPHWKTEGAAVTVAKDPRRTRIGAILERTKLDELPQFWNILKGDMTLVGPRPELPYFFDLLVGRYRAVLDYTPGLFGPSSIPDECDSYPLDEDPETYYRRVLFPRKAELDLAYYPTANTL
ncbi:MAG: sugar transferase, partial [Gammaproteobacteria bacterium]